MTIHATFFLPPSFGRRCPEGAEVGRVKRYFHIRGSQPRLASLVCPFQRKGRECFFKETRIQSLPFAVRDSRFPLICRAVPLSSSVFHTACALSAPAGHLPLEGKADDTGIPSSKKAAHHPCEPIRSPSTVIPSAAEGSLLHCRHMHTCALTHTTPWCFLFRLSLAHDLPLCKKDPSTSVGMTGGRRIISHSLSHRLVEPSCAFGAPLLQGATRIVI